MSIQLPGFQQYLVDKGFKRTCRELNGTSQVENYQSVSVSAYGPLEYNFSNGSSKCYWGLVERGKPPVMNLGRDKMAMVQNPNNVRTGEDGYRILFSKWTADKYDEIYDVLLSETKYFLINCNDENNITIEIKNK